MTALAPETSGSLASLQDSAVDAAVMGAIEGTDDPYEPQEGVEAQETVVDRAEKVEKSAEKSTEGKTKPVLSVTDEEAVEAPQTGKRNPDGTFAKVKPDAKPEAKIEAKADAKDGVPQPTETEAAPKERPKLATDFKVYNKSDGTELDPYDVQDQIEVEIQWKKSRSHPEGVMRLPLDRLAKLAQAGVHHDEIYASAQSALAEHATLTEELNDAKERIKRQNAYVAQLLDSDEVLADSRAKWQAHNTPEALAERLRRENEQLREKLEGQSKAETATSFFQRDVEAPLKMLQTQYPTVTEAELERHLNLLTRHMGAEIQPKDFAAVREIIRVDLPAFAASVHETRSAHEPELRKVRESNTLLKRQAAFGARPIGRSASPSETKPTRKEPRTNDERIDAVIDDVISQGFA